MEDERIDIRILQDGTIEVKTIGYSGSSCEEVINRIARELGSPVSVKKTDEYYEEQVVKEKNKEVI